MGHQTSSLCGALLNGAPKGVCLHHLFSWPPTLPLLHPTPQVLSGGRAGLAGLQTVGADGFWCFLSLGRVIKEHDKHLVVGMLERRWAGRGDGLSRSREAGQSWCFAGSHLLCRTREACDHSWVPHAFVPATAERGLGSSGTASSLRSGGWELQVQNLCSDSGVMSSMSLPSGTPRVLGMTSPG